MNQFGSSDQIANKDKKCHALNHKGSRCGNNAAPGRRFCHAHTQRENLSLVTEDELQRILDAHRLWMRSQKKKGQMADLSTRDLRSAQLSGADLEEALLADADLEAAVLRDAIFVNADLKNTWLLDADVENADFRAAKHMTKDQIQLASNWELALYSDDQLAVLGLTTDDQEGCVGAADNRRISDLNLQGADLSQLQDIQKLIQVIQQKRGEDLSQFQDVQQAIDEIKKANNWMLARYSKEILRALNLPPNHNANLREGNLSELDLRGQDISGAKLAGFLLKDANFQGVVANHAEFVHSDLSKANLRGADLKDADFHDATLRDADLFRADFTSARLERANLQGAILRDAIGLEVAELKKARNWRFAHGSPWRTPSSEQKPK